MGAPQQQRKVLRIGIIQGGRIIEERIIRAGEAVTIGDSNKNTFVLPSAGLPNRFSMFVPKGNQYLLAFTPDMDGKLSMDGGVVMGFDGIREKSVKQKDGSYQFPLTEQIRGKITIAGTTILFQFVPAPAAAAKAAPGDATTSIFKQMDSTYWGIFALSAALHAGLILYAMSLPVPAPMTLEDMPDRFAQIIVPPKPQVEEKKEEKKEGDEKKEEDKKGDDKKEEKAEKKESKKEPAPQISDEDRKAAKKKDIASKGILAVLGAKMGGANNGAFGALISSNSGPGLENLIRSGGGAFQVASGGPGIKGGTGDGGLVGVSDDVGSTGANSDVKVAQREKKAVPKVTSEAPEVKGGDAENVNAVLSRNRGGVLACYENVLKLDPDAKGKLILSFVIEPSGRVSEVTTKVQGFSDEAFESCVKDRAKRWKFKVEGEDSVEVSTSFILSK